MRVVAGEWRVESLIAEGGMGTVHRARHVRSGQPCALKLLRVSWTDAPSRARFLREVQAAAKLVTTGGVCATYGAGFDDDGTPYIAMELLEGATLGELLGKGLAVDAALDVVEAVLMTLASAHDAGIVHRDLKPDNIFVTDAGVVKVLDFGIALDPASARVTATGAVLGTAAYMSPEQSTDPKRVGPATDVWSVGVMLYEIFARELPFTGETWAAVTVKVCTTPHPPLMSRAPEIAPGLLRLVDRCLSKDPVARPATARLLREELVAARAASSLTPTLALDAAQLPQPYGRPAAPYGTLQLQREESGAEDAAPRRNVRGWVTWLAVALTASALLVGGWVGWRAHSGVSGSASGPGSEAVVTSPTPDQGDRCSAEPAGSWTFDTTVRVGNSSIQAGARGRYVMQLSGPGPSCDFRLTLERSTDARPGHDFRDTDGRGPRAEASVRGSVDGSRIHVEHLRVGGCDYMFDWQFLDGRISGEFENSAPERASAELAARCGFRGDLSGTRLD